MGGYISQDPIGLLGGNRLYNYVENINNHLDPLGRSSFNPDDFGEWTDFPDDIMFGQTRCAPQFSDIGSQASDLIRGKSLEDVVEGLKNGNISPDEFVISYTKTPRGEVVTLNNRGLAALTMADKSPELAIYVPYDKVPKHLKTDPPSNSINVTGNKDGSDYKYTITRNH